MSTLFGSSAAAAASNTQGDLKNDVAVKDPPTDSVSEIRFNPKADYLAVGSWDQKVRIYEVSSTGDTAGKAMIDFEGPVLSVAWSDVSSLTL